MAQQTTRNRIINFSGMACENEQQRNCHREAFNSLRIEVSQFDKYQQAIEFTHCERQDCKMVLTNQDRDYIDDWNWVSSNEEHYMDIKDKIDKMAKNKWNYFIWNCRFCGNKNLVEKDKAFFAKSRSKVVLREGVTAEKKIYTSQEPLLLFLIDNSSSMEEQIPELSELNKQKPTNNNNNNTPGVKNTKQQITQIVNDVLKKTQIYQKITENEKKYLNDLKKKIDPDAKNQPYIDHMSKYKILMAMTQKTVNDLCSRKSTTQKQLKLDITSNNSSRKIGFMFFNSDVILQKISGKKEKNTIKVSQKQFEGDKNTQNHIKADFSNFNQLYTIGKNNSQNYGIDISNFKFEDIELNDVNPTGQTALGPALTIAAGIVSGYGAGSLIVIVTDGKANKGIFRQESLYDEQIKILQMRLDKSRAETCLMKLENSSQQEKAEHESSLQKFFRKYATIINVSLIESDPLKQLQSRLIKVLEKLVNSKAWTNEIKIKCQNPNIKFDGDLKKKSKSKLFKDKQSEYISAKIEESKLTSFDYRHPFMTQVLVYYQNIDTKQESKFMAYFMQKLIKYTEMNKKDEASLQSVQTLQNVLNYLEVEGEKLDLSNIPLSICKQSFRSLIMQSYRHSMEKQYKRTIMSDKVLQQQKQQAKAPKTHKEVIKMHMYEKHEELEQPDDQYNRL